MFGMQAPPDTDLFAFLSGPLPIPTLDQYVSISQGLAQMAESIPYETSLLLKTSFGESLNNLLFLGALHFAPQSPETSDLVDYLKQTTNSFSNLTYYIHPNEGVAVEYIESHLEEPTWALVVLNQAEPSNLDFTIRMNYTAVPNTYVLVDWFSMGLSKNYQTYILSGFSTLQRSVNEWMFNYTLSTSSTTADSSCFPSQGGGPPEIMEIPFPTPSFTQNTFFASVGYLLGLAITMATLYPVSKLLKDIVEEKESRMKETMKIMGLKPWIYWLSWFLTALFTFSFIAIMLTLLMSNSFILHSNRFLLFIYLYLFMLSEIGFVFLLSTFFNKAKLAAIVGPISLFASVLPRYIFFSTTRYEAQTYKYAISLLSATSFTFGADILSDFEYANIGVQFDNMHDGAFSFASSLRMMFLDIILYFCLAWYLEHVLPGEYGSNEHPLFCLSPSHWGWTAGNNKEKVMSSRESADQPGRRIRISTFVRSCLGKPENSQEDEEENHQQCGPPQVEEPPDPIQFPPRVVIDGLRKRYADGNVAVKGLDLTMYENQVMCLLGHNGAGKSTTISLVTGLIRPTSGDCLIWDKSVQKDLTQVRQSLGVCPQTNVLYPDLTCLEHLSFFGAIKGVPSKDLAQKAKEMLEEVGLTEKRNVFSKNLSGGMKRKLCLANCFLGSPQFCLLDEPTSGVDPFSRRATWELIRRFKKGRVILLTTHYLDEAEILGDRVAIMSAGRLKTCGTPVWLKSRFGAGYSLTIVKQRRSEETHSQFTTEERAGAITQLIRSHVAEAEIFSDAGAELLYRLPLRCAFVFPFLLRDLDAQGSLLGIDSFGISMTTLEEVFLKLAHDSHATTASDDAATSDADMRESINTTTLSSHEKQSAEEGSVQSPQPKEVPHNELASKTTASMTNTMSGAGLLDNNNTTPAAASAASPSPRLSQVPLWVQLKILIWKRCIVMKRDVKGLVFQVFVPVILIAVVLLILTIKPKIAGPAIPMGSALFQQYEPMDVLYSSPKANTSKTMLLTQSIGSLCESSNKFTRVETGSSYNTSSYLLDTYKSHPLPRLGGYVFDDSILYNITVDYPVIKENIDMVAQVVLFVAEFGMGGDSLSSPEEGVVTYQGPIVVPFSTQGSSISSAVQPEAASTLLEGLLQTLNLTDSQLQQAFNLSTNASLVPLSQGQGAGLSGDLIIQRVEFDTRDDTLFLQDTVLETSGGGSLNLGNMTIPLNSTIPDEKMLYRFLGNNSYTILHNSSSSHTFSAYYGDLVRAKYESCTGEQAKQFVARNHPLPLTQGEVLTVQTVLALFTALFLLIPLTYIPAAFAVFLVKERSCKAHHLQLVSGVNRQMHWISTFLFDMLLYSILSALIMLIFYAYGGGATKTFLHNSATAAATFVLLWMYGLGSLPLTYLYSWRFESPPTAQIAIMGLNFVAGFVFVMAYFIMQSIPKTAHLAERLVHFFRIFPSYNVGEGLIAISTLYFRWYFWGHEFKPFSWGGIGRPITYFSAQLVVYFGALLFIDSDMYDQFRHSYGKHIDAITGVTSQQTFSEGQSVNEDEDVVQERDRILRPSLSSTSSTQRDAVVLKQLTKSYRQSAYWCCGGKKGLKHAVRGVTLGLPPSECFGFLGINGAGKTTTLSIVTGDVRETSGCCFVEGHLSRSAEARRKLGYCPQVDPLIEWMNSFETLMFYGRLKGLPKAGLKELVDKLIHQVGLTKHADKPCGSYSGGNKRKLSLAVAMIGDPPVMLLDEPSSGMDPESRRQMWDVINHASRSRTVILTTHSMEECEALCSRIGIMVGGKLKCLGSGQHLKNKYGSGYKTEIRCLSEGHKEVVCKNLESAFAGQVCLEEFHGLHMRYSIKKGALSSLSSSNLAELFTFLEAAKAAGQVSDYCVSQSSLENVFLRFAQAQEEETTPIKGVIKGVTTNRPNRPIALTTSEEEQGSPGSHRGEGQGGSLHFSGITQGRAELF